MIRVFLDGRDNRPAMTDRGIKMALVQTLTVVDGTGAQQNVPTLPNNLVKTAVNFSASGDQTILAGVSGKTIKLYRLYLLVAAATTLTIKTSSGATIDGPYVFAAAGVLELALSVYAWAETVTADNLAINSASAVQVTGSALTLQS
jgi:hypothetical protein